jgi:hypothetical protein
MKYTSLIVCVYTLKSNDSIGAQVYITLRQFEAAVQDCDKALVINPDWTKAYFRKAIALSEMTEVLGADEQALAVLRLGLVSA